MTHHYQIDTATRSNYYIANEEQSANKLWLIFHGYGQLAKFFIKKFEKIIPEQTVVVAPEATHYFYSKQSGQKRVVANWMTSLYREDHITKNNYYLNELWAELKKKFREVAHVNILGFSQGVPTAMRWLSQTDVMVNQLVLWAGSLPSDHCSLDNIRTQKCYFIFGENDQYKSSFNETKLQLANRFHEKFEVLSFQGGHQLDEATLKQIFSKH